jgi:hypothetical protein
MNTCKRDALHTAQLPCSRRPLSLHRTLQVKKEVKEEVKVARPKRKAAELAEEKEEKTPKKPKESKEKTSKKAEAKEKTPKKVKEAKSEEKVPPHIASQGIGRRLGASAHRVSGGSHSHTQESKPAKKQKVEKATPKKEKDAKPFVFGAGAVSAAQQEAADDNAGAALTLGIGLERGR